MLRCLAVNAAIVTDVEIVHENRKRRIDAVCNFMIPAKEIAKTKLAVDYRDDDEVASFIAENCGRWADGLELPTALQLQNAAFKVASPHIHQDVSFGGQYFEHLQNK